ncbi:MAG: translation initiation factor IF-2 [Bacteroidales bacterium]|jgi:translation initiation factor IF-2|nr:translation initiation factor IF-2 [Bacteroidales bacterium]
MAEDIKIMRLSKASKEFNVGLSTIVDFLSKKGFEIDPKPNTKLSPEMIELLMNEYQMERKVKLIAQEKIISAERTTLSISPEEEKVEDVKEEKGDELFIRDSRLTETYDTPAEKKAEEPDSEPKEQSEPVSHTPDVPKDETPAPPVAEVKEESTEIKEEISVPESKAKEVEEPEKEGIKIVDKIDLSGQNWSTRPKPKSKAQKIKERKEKQEDKAKLETEKKAKIKQEAETKTVKKPIEKAPVPKADPAPIGDPEFIKTASRKLDGPKIMGKIELPEKKKKDPVATSSDREVSGKKKKRRRIKPASSQATAGGSTGKPGQTSPRPPKRTDVRPAAGRGRFDKRAKVLPKAEPTEEEIQQQIKETLARLSPSGKSKASKHRRLKRDAVHQHSQDEIEKTIEEQGVIKASEFVTANELATMMDVPVTKIIGACMSIGLFVSINQRLDAETISIVAEEFGFKVEFVGVEVQESLVDFDQEDNEADLISRSPIVTVMGHVDHGKTKLLDFVRKANVVAGEAGGITQHIGAYEVQLEDGRKITFLDTPGHEAFTAMRARGAKVTDVAIIVIAADDDVMPQTKEAINHAQAASIPIVFAFNKVDKPNANPDNIRNQLSTMNILVEEWGGKYQSQEISALNGDGVDELLEKVLLEAEILELKANPNKNAVGTIIESSLDKGRGYVSKILVQAGTLRIGDMVLAGSTYGKVKAMYNERNHSITEAGPSIPVLMLGLNSAPQAGDGFNTISDEKEAKTIATKRQQLQREQGIRTQKHITLDEIGRRLAIGDFKELNVIVKADVDGSVEALTDSLFKLSTGEIQLNVIHKSVGQISESDVLLASASDAIIVGFQVRPNVQARKLAENEGIQIKYYSIIYQAIEELKLALEGMLAPTEEEKIVANVEIRETFKIPKIGTIGGCMVTSGKITRNSTFRLIRDGIVIYTGKLGSLKRFKDDVKEVNHGYECGMNIDNFNDIQVGDVVEAYEIIEIKRKL